jgi:hypothetical protein
MRKYFRNEHHFFDDLVSLLVSMASLGMATEAHNFGYRPAFKQNERVVLSGSSNVSNTSLLFSPYTLLQPIAKNGWPTVIEFEEQPLDVSLNTLQNYPVKLTGVSGLNSMMIQSAYVHYFETIRPQIKTQYGSNTTEWPDVWNFGRVIRNAFSHGGCINFLNPNAQSVNWKTLTYSPSDNGRQVLYRDLASVDIILLMEDMDSVL